MSAHEDLSALIKDCFYAFLAGGRTMHQAADEAADAILAAGWVPAELLAGVRRTLADVSNLATMREQERDALAATVERVRKMEARWNELLTNGCPSCGQFVSDCDHIEGYHHALSDLWTALDPAERTEGSDS